FHMPPAHRGDVHSFPTRRSSDLFADLAGLFFAVPDRGYGEFFTFFSNVGLQRLAQAGFIVGDEMRSGRENVGSRAVVAFELDDRSEEHTSELQSRENLVCRLLLE